MPINKYLKNSDDRGNITIVVVVSLTVLIGMLALVVDGGNLYATRDKYQNGVEAAAMAGVWHICDSNFETVVRQIAQENGIPYTADDGLVINTGYYDTDDQYDDFSEYGSEYKDFIADSDSDTSYNEDLSDPGNDRYEYNNAVMVSLNANVSTFLAGIFGKEKVAVSAKAVAYTPRYLMISLGEGGNPGITTAEGGYKWGRSGYLPTFHNGFLHSNNDIVFDTSGDCTGPGFFNSTAFAHGRIYTDDGNGNLETTDEFGISGVKLLDIPPIDWSELRALAEANGKVIDMDFYNNLPNECWVYGNFMGIYGSDEFGNYYFLGTRNSVYFYPNEGDHNGRTYFIDIDEGDARNDEIHIATYPSCCDLPTGQKVVTGMTMAAPNLTINFFGAHHKWGGDEEDEIVKFYTGHKIDMGPGMSDHINEFVGTFFRAEGDFGFRQSMGEYREYPIRKLRVIAGGRIILSPYPTDSFGQPEYGFDANFGPPCPPISIHLGRLELAGG